MEFNIYEYGNYQDFLKDLTRLGSKEKRETLTSAALATSLGVTAPTFSKMMSGSLLMQEDHIFLLSQHLNLDLSESAYLSLLGEIQRTGLEKRRKNLELKRIELQRKNHNTPSRLKTEQATFSDAQEETAYYLNPWAPIVHIYLTIPKFQRNSDDLAIELGLSKSFLKETLNLLSKIGLTEKNKSGIWVNKMRTLHSTNLTYLTSAQQLLTRAISLQQLSSTNLNERYGLSVAFSTDADTHEKARQLLINCINEIHQLVSASTPDQVYHLTIDLFDWKKKI